MAISFHHVAFFLLKKTLWFERPSLNWLPADGHQCDTFFSFALQECLQPVGSRNRPLHPLLLIHTLPLYHPLHPKVINLPPGLMTYDHAFLSSSGSDTAQNATMKDCAITVQ